MMRTDKTLMDSNRDNARRNASGRLIKEPGDVTGIEDQAALDIEIQRNQQLNQQLAEQRAKIKGIRSQGTPSARINASEDNNFLLGQRSLTARYRDLTQRLEDPKSIDVVNVPETGWKEAVVAIRVTKSGGMIDSEITCATAEFAHGDFTPLA